MAHHHLDKATDVPLAGAESVDQASVGPAAARSRQRISALQAIEEASADDLAQADLTRRDLAEHRRLVRRRLAPDDSL